MIGRAIGARVGGMAGRAAAGALEAWANSAEEAEGEAETTDEKEGTAAEDEACKECESEEPDPEDEDPEISRQKQNGHIRDTPQHRNRVRSGKPTSTFDGSADSADELTREAWRNGSPTDRPNVRDYDYGRRIGTGPRGGGQSRVRVHMDGQGRIHGHPAGPETGVPMS